LARRYLVTELVFQKWKKYGNYVCFMDAESGVMTTTVRRDGQEEDVRMILIITK
jgi:hypothetical protein